MARGHLRRALRQSIGNRVRLSVSIRQSVGITTNMTLDVFEYGRPGVEWTAVLVCQVGALAGKETVNPGMRVRSNEPCQRDVGRSRTLRRYPHFPRAGSSSQAVRPYSRPRSSNRFGWGRSSSPGATRTGGYASPRPTARTWAPIWGQTLEAGYALAGRLVCPFHGYEFDATGQCVATPYADPPKTAKLRVFETQEVSGLIFA